MKLMSYGIAAIALLTGAAQAETLAINPGEWSFTTEGALSSAGNTMPIPAETALECITEDDTELNIADFGVDDCTLIPVSETSTSAEYNMSCATPAMTMAGTMEIELGDGANSVSLVSRLSGSSPAAGGEMSFFISVEGERVGECS